MVARESVHAGNDDKGHLLRRKWWQGRSSMQEMMTRDIFCAGNGGKGERSRSKRRTGRALTQKPVTREITHAEISDKSLFKQWGEQRVSRFQGPCECKGSGLQGSLPHPECIMVGTPEGITAVRPTFPMHAPGGWPYFPALCEPS